ncbi:peptidoglycan D,D-transpeptidase FtsI family protein [Thiobacter aerophilum]|uniref:Peptidoglycan D,D-transpeptidase FtsI n=1 Tax=Thiobacter aerophilum TaxID=3121275 RepID=A0ABV0EFQ2_9BURK
MIAPAATLPVRLPVWRARLLLVLLVASFLVLVGRAFYLQGVNKDFLRQKGEARYSRVITLNANRGNILDRNGEPLAISTPVESVAASPRDVEITAEQTAKLARLLNLPVPDLKRKLEDSREFVYLKRQLPPDQAEQVLKLDIPGVFLQREYRRYYPYGEQTAHLLGFTDVDDRGQEGVELAFNNRLAGINGSRRVLKDRLGNIIEGVESIRAPQDGQPVVLSIDRNIQYLAYRELQNAVILNRAKAGAVVVLDARSGEVLALANQPSYNPNRRSKDVPPAYMRNRVVTDIFEPGSTLKPFTVAMALEADRVRPDTVIQTAPGYLTIGPATIRDAHAAGALTVAQVIQKSSNVGAAKMALMLPAEYMADRFHKLGFGSPPGVGFPGEAAGRVRPPQTWRPIEQATMSYGHGISVSLLQLARAYTVFANDGELRDLSLLKLDRPAASRRVFSAATARAVRAMLELVVQPGGTALRAQVPGYRVAGKTGTAHKLNANGTYAEDRYVASFVGMAPASDPRLIVAVMIDEPSAGQYYGGQVAAPVFAQIMAGALRMLSVPPDAPGSTFFSPDSAPVVGEST